MTVATRPETDGVAETPTATPPRRRHWVAAAVAGTVVGVGLTAWLLAGQLRQVPTVLQSASWPWVLAAFGFVVVANVARAQRMVSLLSSRMRLARSYEVTCNYNLATAVLPGGLGELALPVTLNRRDAVPLPEATSTLVLTRLLDIVGVLAVGLVSAVVAPHVGGWRLLAVAVTAVGLAASIVLVHRTAWLAARLRPAHDRGGRLRRLLAIRVTALADAMRAQHRRIGRAAIAGTTVMWLATAGMQVALARSFGVPLPWAAGGLAAVVVLLLAAIPIRSVAGIGLQEAGWTLALTAFAHDTHDAAAHALAIHVLTLALLLGLWGTGWLTGRLSRAILAP